MAKPAMSALEPPSKRIQQIYDRIARRFDLMVAPLEILVLRAERRRLLGRARGRVLEVALGTGRNLPHYPPGCQIVGAELSHGMLRQARQRVKKLGNDAALLQMDAEHLAFRDGTFDTVVCTLSLCTIPRPGQALAEMRRVCRPGGVILLLEHVRSSHRLLAWLQDRLTPWQVRRMGCHPNRPTLEHVKEAELRPRTLRSRFFGILMALEASPMCVEPASL